MDSSILHTGNGVYEILLLMPYCKTHVLAIMNTRWILKYLKMIVGI